MLSAFLMNPVLADKTDVVMLKNGDSVTGEIKSLDFGALTYSTDSMGTVSVDWEDVVGLTSNQDLQLELISGLRFFGKLIAAEDDLHITIKTSSEVVSHPVTSIVRMTPIDADDKFLEKLDGSFSMGFQAQKSSEVYTSNVAADISYRVRKFLVGLRLNSTITNQPDEDASVRQSVSLNYQRFRPNRYFTNWFTGWERNDELGLQSRTSAGAAWGRYLVQTNHDQFSMATGVQASRETYTGEDPSDTVAEGLIELRYLHRNIAPDATVNLTATIYPLLSDLSSYRAESDLSWRREFIEDVYFDITLGYSYTSDPPTGAEKSDYVITTSLGYSF
jgi:putative salt-induced outer membrane protein YdiY